MSGLITMRIRRNKKYKTIRCDGVEDCRLTWAAKGLHTYLITRPEGWQVQHTDLLRRSANKRGVLRGCIQILKQYGYLQITRLRDALGKFEGWEWTVFEKPQILDKSQSTPKVKKPNFGFSELRKNDTKNKHKHPQQTKTTTDDGVFMVIQKIKDTPFAGARKSAITTALKKSGIGVAEADLLIEYLIRKYPTGGDNPPGLLIQALQKGWQVPENFRSATQMAAERAEAEKDYQRRVAIADNQILQKLGLGGIK